MTSKTVPGKLTPETDSRLSLVRVAAAEYQMEPAAFLETLKKTIFPGGNATNEQMAAFIAVAHQYRLNPFLKEIHAFPTKGGGIIPVVGIDGWVSLINRQPELEWIKLEEVNAEDGTPFCVTCTIKRRDRAEPLGVTEYYAECRRDTDPWRQMPHRMLRHKAMKESGRYSFGFGGIQDEDEARDVLTREAQTERPAIPAITRKTAPATAVVPDPGMDQAQPLGTNPDADVPADAHGLPLDWK